MLHLIYPRISRIWDRRSVQFCAEHVGMIYFFEKLWCFKANVRETLWEKLFISIVHPMCTILRSTAIKTKCVSNYGPLFREVGSSNGHFLYESCFIPWSTISVPSIYSHYEHIYNFHSLYTSSFTSWRCSLTSLRKWECKCSACNRLWKAVHMFRQVRL